MLGRILAIIFIFVSTTVAWMILGASVAIRSEDSSSSMKSRVESLWGGEQIQEAPVVTYRYSKDVEVTQNDGSVDIEKQIVSRNINLDSSRIDVGFELEHRKKGLLWFSTYRVEFESKYTFKNSLDREADYSVLFSFPASDAVYDNFRIIFNGKEEAVTPSAEGVIIERLMKPGEKAVLEVSYNSQGLGKWEYAFSNASVATVNDFKLTMKTDFEDIDFPEETLSPTSKTSNGKGWDLNWEYGNLISGVKIGMKMPQKLNPGPVCSRITFFAPVSLLFFFFVMFMICVIKGIDIHPMNYFFLAAAFFAFHLLFAYLVDHLSVHLSFAISSAVSIFLVISYLRLVTGVKFALIDAGLSQFVYLILFSYAFFFEGITGLAITIGAIVTLFVAMQLTGKINWSEKFKSGHGLKKREDYTDK